MINFDELAEQCKKRENLVEGIVDFVSEVFKLETYFMPGHNYSMEGQPEKLVPFAGETDGVPCVFIFTDIDKCCDFSVQNGIVGADGKASIIQFDMKDFNENMMFFIQSGIVSSFINCGEHGLNINIEGLIELYTKIVLKQPMVKFGLKENTEVLLRVPDNFKKIKDSFVNMKEGYPEIENLYVSMMAFKANPNSETFFILIDFKDKGLDEVKKEEVFNRITKDMSEKSIIKETKISFIDSIEILPEELKKEIKMW